MLKSKFTGQISFVFAFFIFSASLTGVFSQSLPNTMAQLRILGNAPGGEMLAVNINGEKSANGSSLVSPAKITVPSSTTAVVNFENAGQIELSPGTVVNLTFNGANVTADLSQGRLRITSLSDATFNVKTADGTIANDKSQSSVFVAEVVGGATGVNTEAGVALVNGTPVRAGDVWTANPNFKSNYPLTKMMQDKKDSRRKFLWKAAIIGAAAVGAGILIGTQIN